jgi:hypothetical protein
MSYTTLNTLSSAFSSAVDATTGLDSYLMIDSSELNAHHNINYPVCVVEPPNSSVSNINKAWEDYDVSCFVLQVDDSNVDNVIQYDTCLSLFTSFLANLMKQRDGEYVLDKDSISIERIRGEGNDNLIGVKVGFNLLVPSVLISDTADLTVLTDGLYGYWDGDRNVAFSHSSLSWGSADGTPQRTFTNTGESTEDIPSYDSNGGAFIFQGFSALGKAETLMLSDVTFTNANHSIFFRLQLPEIDGDDEQILYEFPPDAEGDYNRVVIIKGGAHDGKFKITVDDNAGNRDDFDWSDDNLPIGSRTQFAVVGFINNASDELTTISINNRFLTSGNYRNDVITNSDLHVGSRHITGGYGDMSGYLGVISHIAIYDKALSKEQHEAVVSKMLSER